jgi:hypothetical protein
MNWRLGAILLVAFLAMTAHAAEKIQLFNGKNLDGWTAVSSKQDVTMEDVWDVREGLLHCKGTPAGYLKTDKTYTSFLLHVEWRTIKKGNGGVLIRKTGPDKVWPKSIECQLLTDNAGDIWNIDHFPMEVDPTRTHDRQTVKLHPSNEKPIGGKKEWNTYDILMDGHNLTLMVNGVVQNTASDVEIVAGNILIQSEGAEMEYQNIWLVPLPDEGMDKTVMKGWHPLGSGTWTVEDGAIVGRHRGLDKDYGHLVSDARYKDFKASFKFKCIAGNSGFYFHSQPQGLEMHGIQAEIDEKKDVGGLYESYGRNWVSHPKPDDVAKWFKPQEWNDMTVQAQGNHFTVTVNGQTSADLVDDASRKDGVFALQLHVGDGEVLFKDMVIEGEPLPVVDASVEMTKKAVALYQSLSADQKQKAVLPFDAPQRVEEVFTPGTRAGIPLGELTDDQRAQAMDLITMFTSDYGKQKALAVAGQDGKVGLNKYFLVYFGEPGTDKSYAWRVAEHHLTLVDVEVEKGKPAMFGPILLGANPSTLWDEDEDKLMALYGSLDADEKTKAQHTGKGVSSEAIGDAGILVGSLSSNAQRRVQAVLDSRLRFFSPEIQQRITELVEKQGGLREMKIAFYGEANKRCRDGGKWDFKLGSAGFLCDYENSRGHIHMSMKGKLSSAQ